MQHRQLDGGAHALRWRPGRRVQSAAALGQGARAGRHGGAARPDQAPGRRAQPVPDGRAVSALQLAGGAVVAGIWKVAAVVLAVLLLVVITSAGTGWWLAAAARDEALASLVAEQGASAALRASIGVQNEAVHSMHRATVEADARGRAAQAQAAAKGRRYDAAQARLAGTRATTCDDAMPFVDQLLKDVK